MQLRVWLPIAALYIFSSLGVVTAENIQQEIAAAKQMCDRNSPGCVEKLVGIADKLVAAFREHGDRNDEALNAVWAELKKHPLPADSDSKKLSKLLVGKWDSPRHTYVFRADGKYGLEDELANQRWQIKGNQFIQTDSKGTIILLNSKYFIYQDGADVFFHSRVGQNGD
jgi:hypothetical protein